MDALYSPPGMIATFANRPDRTRSLVSDAPQGSSDFDTHVRRQDPRYARRPLNIHADAGGRLCRMKARHPVFPLIFRFVPSFARPPSHEA